MKKAGSDLELVSHELRQLLEDLITGRDHTDRALQLSDRIRDALATLESFTLNRDEILRLDHVGCTEMLRLIDPDVLEIAVTDLNPQCRAKIRMALDRVEGRAKKQS